MKAPPPETNLAPRLADHLPTFRDLYGRITPPSPAVRRRVQARLDQKTKPPGSLGKLEGLAVHLAGIWGDEAPPARPKKAIVVMGADHGVAAEGVSAFPSDVTTQMLLNFAEGGAAINVLAKAAGAEIHVIDMGTAKAPPAHQAIVDARQGPGTRNLKHEAAMSVAQTVACLEVGLRTVERLVHDGYQLIGIGEMGIANTTSASALAAAWTGHSPALVTGRGTGVDDRTFLRKVEVVEAALARTMRDLMTDDLRAADATDVLASLGGFEIAGLAGVCLGAALHRVPVLVDGFIATAAAFAAVRLAPACQPFLVGSHTSVEPGHRVICETLQLAPLLDLGLRLGEGTGAALAMPLCDAALAILQDMATFESAGVSNHS